MNSQAKKSNIAAIWFILFINRSVSKGSSQRARLAAVWELAFRLPVTAAWLCFVVEVKNFCLALFVEPITEAK
jgi:hypothetical protein